MKKSGAILALVALAGALGLLLWRRTSPPATPERRVAAPSAEPVLVTVDPFPMPAPPPPPAQAGADRFYDGRQWRDFYWAADQVRVVSKLGTKPETLLKDAVILDRSARAATARVKPVSRAEFAAEAKRIRSQAGADDALPVFYTTAGLEGRPLFLSRQVVATLPPNANAAAVAASHGAVLLRAIDALPDTYVFKVAEPFDTFAAAEGLVAKSGARFAMPEFTMVPVKSGPRKATVINDPLYLAGNQWHLNGTEGVRADLAWNTTMGVGAVIGLIDDGMQWDHPDLQANYRPDLSWDFDQNDSNPYPAPTIGTADDDDHGTAVTGVAAAVGENGIGVMGAAPHAQFAGLRLISLIDAPNGVPASTIASAFSYQNGITQIKSNSWGFNGDGPLDGFPHSSDTATIVAESVNGRGGKGTVFLFAGGNGRVQKDNVNYSGYGGMRQVISVAASTDAAAVAYYSSPGSALLVAAPSDGGTLAIETTDRTGTGNGYNPAASPGGDYCKAAGPSGFGGTSSATPLTAGVVGLMLSANPNLTSRDVRHVLVRTARPVSTGDGSWVTNAAGRQFSENFGFGVVDANAAVLLAKQFPRPPAEQMVTGSASPGLPIPDATDPPPAGPPFTPGAPVQSIITIGGTALRVEAVEVIPGIRHTYRGDLSISLTHGGRTSHLAVGNHVDPGDNYSGWQFLSNMYWGESSLGDWTLTVQDLAANDAGTFDSWTIKIYGVPFDVTPPASGVVRDGLGADVSAQASTSTISANWTFVDEGTPVYEWAIGTTPGATNVQAFTNVGDATSATATGLVLTPGQTYYVSVRATNFENLTSTVSSNGVLIDVTAPTAPGTPTPTPTLGNTGTVSLTWSAGTDPGGSGVSHYVLQRALNGGGFSTIQSALATTTFDDTSLPEGSYTYRVQAVDAAGNTSSFSGTSAAAVVDLTAPNTTITGKPANPSGQASPTFTFGATEGGCSFTYKLDGGANVPIGLASTVTIGPLAPGAHTMSVFATDGAGNADPTPATYAWTITTIITDGTAPFINPFDSSIYMSSWTATSTGAPAWAADATPATFLGGAKPYFTGPASLNYNNGTDYATGGVPNSGMLTSPVIDRSAVTGNATLRFMCNYESDTTGLTSDTRTLLILSPDLLTTWTTVQLSSLASAAGPCASMGTWHEHVLPLSAGWGTSIRVRFAFDTVDAVSNAHAGWFIDDLEISNMVVTALNQYPAGGTNAIPVGAGTLAGTLDFRGIVSSAASGAVQLDVEVQPVGVPFSGIATASAVGGVAGLPLQVTIPMPAYGAYHWRARTIDGGGTSGWTEFGLNGLGAAGTADFVVVPAGGGGGGGGGGCGATGLEGLAIAALLAVLRRRRS